VTPRVIEFVRHQLCPINQESTILTGSAGSVQQGHFDLRFYLGNDHRAMIRRRVDRIVERINTRSGASHLKEKQTKRLRPVTNDVTRYCRKVFS
jgi:hypothetical protein